MQPITSRIPFIYFLFALLFPALAQAQMQNLVERSIVWNDPVEIENMQRFSFSEVRYRDGDFRPLHSRRLKLRKQVQNVNVSVVATSTSPLSTVEKTIFESLNIPSSELMQIDYGVSVERFQPYLIYSFVPFTLVNGEIHKVVSYELAWTITGTKKPRPKSSNYASHSVLASGDWYKIGVVVDGIYKIDLPFLEQLGVDVSNLAPGSVHVYGNGVGMLPEDNEGYRPDDLLENATGFYGNESDGSFDPSDYLLFYGKGPRKTYWSSRKMRQAFNAYSDTSYYFIKIDPNHTPKRMGTQPQSTLPSTQTVTSFNDHYYYNPDLVNFWESGKVWYGDTYNNIKSSYTYNFNIPNVTNDSLQIDARFAARSISTAVFKVSCQGKSASVGINATSSSSDYARQGTVSFRALPSSSSSPVTVNFNMQGVQTAEGWIDYLEINARRNLIMSGNQMEFRDVASVGTGEVSEFQLSGATGVTEIWETTQPTNVSKIDFTDGGLTKSFVVNTDSIRSFVAITNASGFQPMAFGKVQNQDLHALGYADLILVTPTKLTAQAADLADFHRSRGTSVHLVNINQIYNEFSSGMRDATAIRHFLRMFYFRAAGDPTQVPKSLLLFGDGSYDNKGRLGNSENLLPTYQSNYGELSKTITYTSDDYFVVLDDAAAFQPDDLLDMAVGRLPISTPTEAVNVVNKIKNYTLKGASFTGNGHSCSNTSQPSTFGDWKNKVMLVSDDEDGSTYVSHTENIANVIANKAPGMNLNKVHSDAYVQESTPGGERYPDVNAEIQSEVENGVLAVNYIGHGGEVGWAEERILDLGMIQGWSNTYHLPIFMTATCEFSRFDDPDRTSAGEYMVLNPNGGAIAMFTTWRLVYAGPNLVLNQKFYDTVFQRHSDGRPQTLGEIYMATKNTYATTAASDNGRKFGLLGDPALQLALPTHRVVTDKVNGVDVSMVTDTLKALSKVKLEGHLEDGQGNLLNGFDGVVYLTVFDKNKDFKTLSNNVSSPERTFQEQTSVLYKGKASVSNGLFAFEFVVPKDIDFQFGLGKLSYYADNGVEDATGYNKTIVVGGTNGNAPVDNEGPEIQLYLNDSNFVFGGYTNEKPVLLAFIADSNGVNTVGNSIGHDLIAVLDGNTSNAIVLNEQYESDVDTYQKGSVIYQFDDLSAGSHTLSLKAWDVYNNSSTAYTEFVVANSAEMALEHVLNYPNPFTTSTEFMLEHNQVCNSVDVSIQVFTASGRLVKTMQQQVNSEGFRVSGLMWNGTDDFGDKLARGVYMYKVKVTTPDGKKAEKFEKLVILK